MDMSPSMPRKDKIRYLTSRPGAGGELPRHFWQPSKALRDQGYRLRRLPRDWEAFADPAALYAAAAAEAIAINQALDVARDSNALAAARPPEPVRRTVSKLIAAYKLSPAYTTLAIKTRRDYDQCLARIDDWAGDCLIASLDGARLDTFRRSLAATPAMMNAVMRILRLTLNWGMEARNRHPGGGRWCTENIAARPDLEARPVSGRIWPRQAVALMVAKADALGLPGLGTAIMLNEWIGQREADMLRLPRTVYRAGSLIFRQAKGTNAARAKLGAGVVLPIGQVPALVERVALQLAWNDAYHKDNRDKGRDTLIPLTIALNAEGRAYKADNFRHRFAEVRAAVEADMLRAAGWAQDEAGAWSNAEAEKPLGNYPKKERDGQREILRRRAASFEVDYLLPGRDIEDPDAFRVFIGELQFMHLRHTAIVRLAESGVTIEDIAAVSGHSLKTVHTILERYLIRTAKMAGNAFAARMAKEAEGG